MTVAEWPRVSDWKASIEVVHIDDLESAFLAEHGLEHPVDRLQAEYPGLAELLRRHRFVRVGAPLAARLHSAGRLTTRIEIHRGVGMLSYRDVGPRQDAKVDVDFVEIAADLAEADDVGAHDDIVDGAGLAATPWTLWVAVAAAPIVVLCVVVVALHEAMIRQGYVV